MSATLPKHCLGILWAVLLTSVCPLSAAAFHFLLSSPVALEVVWRGQTFLQRGCGWSRLGAAWQAAGQQERWLWGSSPKPAPPPPPPPV